MLARCTGTELANIHSKLGHLPEATKIMMDARNEFGKTAESARYALLLLALLASLPVMLNRLRVRVCSVTIADADLAVRRRDYEAALSQLKLIPSDSRYYTRAKMKVSSLLSP